MAKQFDHVKDSGEREEFSTGARRDTQTGKGRFDLLPINAMFRLAKHFENGAVKYGDSNWMKGIPLRRYADSMLRHSFKFLGGLDDEDHLTAIIWNAMCLLETQELINKGKLPKELNNLPEPVLSSDDFYDILKKTSEIIDDKLQDVKNKENDVSPSEDATTKEDMFDDSDTK